MPGKLDITAVTDPITGVAISQPTFRDSRAYEDGVRNAFDVGAGAAAALSAALFTGDPVGGAAYDAGVVDAGAGTVSQASSYRGQTSPA